jgi:hypothetical protein
MMHFYLASFGFILTSSAASAAACIVENNQNILLSGLSAACHKTDGTACLDKTGVGRM